MLDKRPNSLAALRQLQKALSQWENEGGAIPLSPQVSSTSEEVQPEVPPLTNAELMQLRIRVIALENLVITLLEGAHDRQLDLACENGSLYIAAAWRQASSSDHPRSCSNDRFCCAGGSFPSDDAECR